MSKIGRPKTNGPHRKGFHLSVKPHELDEITEAHVQLGINRSKYLLMCHKFYQENKNAKS